MLTKFFKSFIDRTFSPRQLQHTYSPGLFKLRGSPTLTGSDNNELQHSVEPPVDANYMFAFTVDTRSPGDEACMGNSMGDQPESYTTDKMVNEERTMARMDTPPIHWRQRDLRSY